MMKKKRNTEVKKRHWLIIRIAKVVLWPIYRFKYRYEYTYHKELKGQGPFLVIANHTVAFDPILLGLSFPYANYYIASEQIFNLGLISKMLKFAVNPISKAKAANDITTIRKSRRIVSEGGSIAVYPEGNVTYDGKMSNVNKSIVSFIRFLKLPILVYKTSGLYFTDPRWARFSKKGKSRGYISKIIERKDYDQLTDDELYELVLETINVNAYVEQEEELVAYKGKRIAEGLERLIFMDLNTNKPFVTYTKGNKLMSEDSDFSLTYDEYGYVTDELGNKHTLITMNERIKEAYYNFIMTTDKYLLKEERVFVALTTKKHKNRKGFQTLKLYKDKIELTYSRKNHVFNFSEINISIQGKKKLIIISEKETYLLTLDVKSSPYKYLLTYQIYHMEENGNERIRQLGL